MPNTDDDSNRFDPENLVRTVIAVPLLKDIEADPDALRYVIIDSNVRYSEGRHRRGPSGVLRGTPKGGRFTAASYFAKS